jgi:hypothetical protein
VGALGWGGTFYGLGLFGLHKAAGLSGVTAAGKEIIGTLVERGGEVGAVVAAFISQMAVTNKIGGHHGIIISVYRTRWRAHYRIPLFGHVFQGYYLFPWFWLPEYTMIPQ